MMDESTAAFLLMGTSTTAIRPVDVRGALEQWKAFERWSKLGRFVGAPLAWKQSSRVLYYHTAACTTRWTF